MAKRIVPVVLILAAVVAVVLVLRGRDTGEDGRILLSGTVEVIDVDLSFKLPGRVAERLVSEGDRVAAGEVVARLDTSELEAEVALREAALRLAKAARAEVQASRPGEIDAAEAAADRARAAVRDLEAGAREQELRAAEAAREAAAAERERLAADFRRAKSLLEQKVIPKDEFDRVTAARDVAGAKLREAEERLALLRAGSRSEQIAAAEAAVRQAEAELALVREGPREERRDQAAAAVAEAEAALSLARIRLEDATLRSPIDGEVLVEHAEAGEFLAAGAPVVTVADLGTVRIRAFLDETDLGRVKPGLTAQVITDTWPDEPFEGVVTWLSPEAEFTPKSVATRKERVRLVYRLRVEVENPEGRLRPGMPVDVEIREAP